MTWTWSGTTAAAGRAGVAPRKTLAKVVADGGPKVAENTPGATKAADSIAVAATGDAAVDTETSVPAVLDAGGLEAAVGGRGSDRIPNVAPWRRL